MSLKNKILIRAIPGFVVLLLSIIWYRPGLILGGGEGGLPFYNLQNNLEIVSHAWVDKSIGNPTGIVVSTVPTIFFLYAMQSLLQNSGLTQIVFFSLLNLIAIYGMYFLIRAGFRYPQTAALFGSIFYVLNPVATYTIWQRFQITYIVLYAFLPLILLFTIRTFEKRNFSQILLLNLVLLFASMSFASLPMTLLAWLVIGSYWLFVIIQNILNFTSIRSLTATLFLVLFVFLLWHVWWILPFVQTMRNSPFIVTQAYQQDGNLQTYMTLSDRLGQMSYAFRGIHPEQFTQMSALWWNINQSPLYILITWVIPVLAFYPLFTASKDRRLFYLLGSALFVLFSMKGSAAPFGFLWQFFFSHIRILESFRNPYEKWSILLPLFYAPLIGYALVHITHQLSTRTHLFLKLSQKIVPVLSMLAIIFAAYPMLTRLVFMSTESPANQYHIGIYNQVPDYYAKTNQYLEAHRQNSRLLIVPYRGEGITHTWDYGYSGVELSMDIFRAPAISLSTGVQFLPQVADQLEQLLRHKPEAIPRVLPYLNISHILVRDDIDTAARALQDPQLIRSELEKDSLLQLVEQFGDLAVFAPRNLQDQTFHASTSITTIPSDDSLIYTDVVPYSNNISTTYLQIDDVPSTHYSLYTGHVFTSSTEIITHPPSATEEQFLPLSPGEVNPENALNELPHVKHDPGSPLYTLVRIKEKLAPSPKDWSDAQFDQLKLAGKRLVETKLYLDRSPQDASLLDAFVQYETALRRLEPGYIALFPGVQSELLRHKIVLEQVIHRLSNYPKSLQRAEQIHTYLQELFYKGVTISGNSNINFYEQKFKLDVPEAGYYQMHLSHQNNSSISKIIINNQDYPVSQNQLGQIFLNQGANEIRFPNESKKLQVTDLEEVRIYAYQEVKSPQAVLPQITYQKKSPTEYQLQVTNARSPFVLVFNTAYHPLWNAQLPSGLVSSANHVLANNYANAWLIDQQGDFFVQISYQGQKYHDLGKIISIVSILITLISYGAYQYLNNRNAHSRE